MIPFPPISIGLIHFPTCGPEHLIVSLASVLAQEIDWGTVKEILIYDNASGTPAEEIERVVHAVGTAGWPSVRTVFDRHGDPTKTHPYSLNRTLEQLAGPALFLTRSDYILHPQMLPTLVTAAQAAMDQGQLPFVSAWCQQGAYDRQEQPYPPYDLPLTASWADRLAVPGHVFTETDQDAGVWLSLKGVLGDCRLNEHLSAWGYAQSTWQRELASRGVRMIAVPEVLFFHQQHGDWARDHALARAQYDQFGGGR